MNPSIVRQLVGWFFAVIAALVPVRAAPDGAAPDVPEKSYLFAYFLRNGEDGLHFAWSTDGLKWQALKEGKSFLTPQVGKSKLMRDPCITRGPDGTFHMVWTDSWDSGTIGYAFSKDLIKWSEQKAIPVMAHEPTVRNCWAPEIIYDPQLKRFMIFWSSTIPGKFPETQYPGQNNHRIYMTTTADFVKFTPTEVLLNPGFNCIDATILPFDGKAVMFFKDESKAPQAMKNLRIATASAMAGPYQVEKDPLTPPGSWVEGPSALKIGDEVILYFDAYTKHRYEALSSRDLRKWQDVTGKLSMPKGVRHGTAFEVPAAVAKALLNE